MSGVRIDKWLWAARFFKTRAKAKEAIDGGKVHVNGQRTKPSKELVPGDTLQITQGYDEKVVVVNALSDQRRSATIAQKLYEETLASQEKRALRAEQRKAAGSHIMSEGRPSKKDRRQIHRFRDQNQ
ncbi:MAG: RNA-binding protein [Pseudomonadales bacterium]|nr:RNA-binding protein [Pseudomonadales bacterium]MBO6596536.1 RNA-binding protein [Pseudomonadales bacterium]MBO6823475.1 RNA-binding protein [Pseudomonadales bacterium]